MEFFFQGNNDGFFDADLPTRHLDRSEAEWRDMTVQACGPEFLATRTLTQASRGHHPHTPGRAYFSAPLEMTSESEPQPTTVEPPPTTGKPPPTTGMPPPTSAEPPPTSGKRSRKRFSW